MSDFIDGQLVCFTETHEVSGAVTRYAKYEHGLRAFNNARNIRHLTAEEVGPSYIPTEQVVLLQRQLDEALRVMVEQPHFPEMEAQRIRGMKDE